jgi:hypothetical protein
MERLAARIGPQTQRKEIGQTKGTLDVPWSRHRHCLAPLVHRARPFAAKNAILANMSRLSISRSGMRSGPRLPATPSSATMTENAPSSLLAGTLFDEGNRMTPSHAVKKGTARFARCHPEADQGFDLHLSVLVRTRMPAGHLSVRPRCAKLCARVSSLAVGRNMGPGERRACGRITSSSARARPAARWPTGVVKLNNRSASQIYVWIHDNLFPGCNRSWCPKHKFTRPIS